MLKISKLADYGTVLMQQMSAHIEQRFSAASLAEQTDIPVPTVSKILKLLNDADLVCSCRGANGGYQLARQPEMISIVDIISAIDEAPAITECVKGDNICARDSMCQLKSNWRYINDMVLDVLRPISLADMSRRMTKANGKDNGER